MDPLPKQKTIDPTFLTRRMLSYEQGLPLALRLTVHSVSTSLVKVVGFTKDAVFSFEMTPASNLTQQVQTFSLTDFPIWLSIVTDDDTLRRGDVYAKVELMIRNTPHGTLAQGYVASLETPTWPNGISEGSLSGRVEADLQTFGDPGVGNQLSVNVPANQYWIVKAVDMRLITDANAANRRLHLRFTDPSGSTIMESTNDVDQAASLTRRHHFGAYGHISATSDDDDIFYTIPLDFPLETGATIRTFTTNFQAGDDLGALAVYRERYISPS